MPPAVPPPFAGDPQRSLRGALRDEQIIQRYHVMGLQEQAILEELRRRFRETGGAAVSAAGVNQTIATAAKATSTSTAASAAGVAAPSDTHPASSPIRVTAKTCNRYAEVVVL